MMPAEHRTKGRHNRFNCGNEASQDRRIELPIPLLESPNNAPINFLLLRGTTALSLTRFFWSVKTFDDLG